MNPILGFILCLAAMLIIGAIVTITLKYTSRWNQLEQLYLNTSKDDSVKLEITSLRIASPLDPWGMFNSFRNVVFVGSNDKGIYFSMIFPFRLILRPIFIPWNELIIAEQSYIGVNRDEIIPTKLPEIQFILTKSVAKKIRNLIKV